MLRLGVAAGVAAVIVAFVAVVDHRHKQDVELAAQEDAWFCAHGRPSSCRDFDQAAYEERWERRELLYRGTFVVLIAGGLAFGLVGSWQRQRPRR